MTAGNKQYSVPVKVRPASKSISAEFERVVHEVSTFAVHVGDTLRASPKESARFIRECVASTPVLFQKWTLEILYLLALLRELRFSRLKEMLTGISSRTLSLKLADLEERGLVIRAVREGRPLRVDYSLSDDGRTAARLSVPLVMYLNLRLGLRLETEAPIVKT